MGIRESLEKQALEEKDLKLSDFSLEQEEPEERNPYFDPEKDISEEEKKEFIQRTKTQLDTEDSNGFYNARILSITLPDNSWQLEINKYQQQAQKFADQKEKNAMHLLEKNDTLRYLFPQIFGKNYLRQEDIQKIIDKIKSEIKNEGEFMLTRLVDFKILFPDRIKEFDLEKAWLFGLESLKYFKKENDYWDFMHDAAFLRILFPERYGQLHIAQADWQEMKKFVIGERLPEKLEEYYCLSILAAHEIKFTDRGFELVMKKPEFKKEKQQRPERRAY